MVVEIARGNYYRAEKKTELTLARVGEGYGGGLKGSETILKYKKISTKINNEFDKRYRQLNKVSSVFVKPKPSYASKR